jgi:hypothetical protein
MKTAMCFAVLLVASFAWARPGQPARSDQPSNDNGQVTVRGCVSMLNGDYVLTKQDPGNTYELQQADKIRLKSYLGQRVQITGTKLTTLPTSEDAINARMGSASPVTIRLKSIKTISKECETK